MVSEEAVRARVRGRAERVERNRLEREQSSIEVGQYSVFKLDSLNWCVEETGKEHTRRYYSDLPLALKRLLVLGIGDEARNDIASVLSAVEVAERKILQAIEARAGGPGCL